MKVIVKKIVSKEDKKDGYELCDAHTFNHINWSKVEEVVGDDYYVAKAVELGAKTTQKLKK